MFDKRYSSVRYSSLAAAAWMGGIFQFFFCVKLCCFQKSIIIYNISSIIICFV